MRISRILFFHSGYDSTGCQDFRGLDLLEREWTQYYGESCPWNVGQVVLPYADTRSHWVVRKGEEISRSLPLDLTSDHLRIEYEEADLAVVPFAQLAPMDSIALDEHAFKAGFHSWEDATGSYCEQRGPLSLTLARHASDISEVVYRDARVGWVVSGRVRELLSYVEGVRCLPIRDTANGATSNRFWQLQSDIAIPLHPRTILEEGVTTIGGRAWPGLYLGSDDPRDNDLYFAPDLCRDATVFVADQYVGPRYLQNDSHKPMVFSQTALRLLQAAGVVVPMAGCAYAVAPGDPDVWGGTLFFKQEEFMSGNYTEWYTARETALTQLLGAPEKEMWSPRVPLHLGGEACVLVFREFIEGIAYVTSDLIGLRGQKPNSTGQYELMICTRSDCEPAAGLISYLARYTLDQVLEAGDTMDVTPAVPAGSSVSALLFVRPDFVPEGFSVKGVGAGILMCIGITPAELEACRSGKTEKVAGELRKAGVYPYTELVRESVI